MEESNVKNREELQEEQVRQLEQLLAGKKYRELREAFADMNEVDIARFMEDLPSDRAVIAFRTLPKDVEMDVFAELSADVQAHIVGRITDNEIAGIVDELYVDDAVDMLEEMPAALVKRVLRNSSPETRSLINQFLMYPKDAAGSLMTAEFTDLRASMTVEDAIKRIRRIGEDRETIYTCYVMDDTRHLEGVVTVKDLLLAHDTDLVGDLMETNLISVHTADKTEDVTRLMVKYDLMAMPVVDAEERLVGIITVDDALDAMQEEDTEDFEIMNALAPSERPYLKTSVFTLAKNRFGWLMILMVSGMITGAILGHYEAIYAAIPALVAFMPMLTGTGGNAGSQSSTMVIRGMALGEIGIGDVGRVVWKEMRVAVLVGVALAIVNYIRITVMQPEAGLVTLVVSLTLIAVVFVAKVIGGALPILAKACKLDPAIMAAPLITTIVDALAYVVYLNIARALLL